MVHVENVQCLFCCEDNSKVVEDALDRMFLGIFLVTCAECLCCEIIYSFVGMLCIWSTSEETITWFKIITVFVASRLLPCSLVSSWAWWTLYLPINAMNCLAVWTHDSLKELASDLWGHQVSSWAWPFTCCGGARCMSKSWDGGYWSPTQRNHCYQ